MVYLQKKKKFEFLLHGFHSSFTGWTLKPVCYTLQENPHAIQCICQLWNLVHLPIGFDLLKSNLKYWWTVVLISKIPAYWNISGSTATITPFWNLSNYSDNHIIKTDIHYSYLQLYPITWSLLGCTFSFFSPRMLSIFSAIHFCTGMVQR